MPICSVISSSGNDQQALTIKGACLTKSISKLFNAALLLGYAVFSSARTPMPSSALSNVSSVTRKSKCWAVLGRSTVSVYFPGN